jgi:hypothetical protein
MTFDFQDLKRLRWSLLLFLGSVLLSAGSAWVALHNQWQTEQRHASVSAADKASTDTFLKAHNEENEIREKIAQFQTLKMRGIIGPERRLDWMETIAHIKADRHLTQIDYEFSPQRPVDANILPGGAAAGPFTLKTSEMHLQLPLMHEGELLGFLADLRANAAAWIQIRRCAIQRRTESDLANRAAAPLSADCTLEWITFDETT